MPVSILKSAEIVADANGSYQSADSVAMTKALRWMKLFEWFAWRSSKEMDQEMQGDGFRQMLQDAVPSNQVDGVIGVISSVSYIHDEVGVPRDLPLTSARYFWASLKWGIDTLMVVYKSKK